MPTPTSTLSLCLVRIKKYRLKEGILLKRLKNPTSKNKGFSYLVDLYHEKIYWMIRKMVLSHDSANDVLQNTYIRIFKGIENFKEKSKLSTWIYRIAYNESIRFLTNESKLKKVELDSNDDNYSRKLYADEYFDAENLSLKFHQILSDLSLRQRNIFNMKYFDELKFSEISKITDMNINTIKFRLYFYVPSL